MITMLEAASVIRRVVFQGGYTLMLHEDLTGPGNVFKKLIYASLIPEC